MNDSGEVLLKSGVGAGTTDSVEAPLSWRDVTFNVEFGILVLSLLITITWFTFLTFYLSRMFGLVFTWGFNSLSSSQNRLQIGSISLSVLSGKVMFRNFKYLTEDYTVRIQDGWVVFRYWRHYAAKTLGDDFSHEDPRVLSHFNGVEVHFYNWTEKYLRIAELFGLDETVGAKYKKDEEDDDVLMEEVLKKRQQKWRSLIPVATFEISSGRFSCGNKYLPTTAMISLENAVGTYATKPPSRPESGDWFMHSLRGTCENFRMALVKTPTYTGTLWEEPPRTMGEGFVVLQTAQLEYYYYHDQLGLVTKEPCQSFNEGEGPAWGTDFRLGKNTIISYGPWADKQRDYLYKFFYPPDYQRNQKTAAPSKSAKHRRIHTQYDIRVSTLNDATMDILFMRGEDPNALHIGLKQGSYLEVSAPMIIRENGFRTKIMGQLMHMEASTSIEFRPLMECETLEFVADLKYPREWNGHQFWDFSFTGCKAIIFVVFDLKYFLHDLINEWADQNAPDLFKFLPWTCRFNAVLSDFELILGGLNPHNWIDTSSIDDENIQAGICGKNLELGFSLPFTTFQPESTKLRFAFNAETLELRVKYPEQHILHHILKSFESLKQKSMTDSAVSKSTEPWSGVTTEESGWLSMWKAPQAIVSLDYEFHSVQNVASSHLPKDLLREILPQDHFISAQNFHPTRLKPDQISVEVELGPSQAQFSALIIKLIFALKENYFGECDRISNIEGYSCQNVQKRYGNLSSDDSSFDARKYRPLHVTVSVVLHNIEANCVMYNTGDECPVAHVEQLAFEMDKRYQETRLQLNLSPIVLKFPSGPNPGVAVLSAMQFRGHAMFSDTGLPLDASTSEYAWLMEIILGDLIGRISPSHLVQVVQYLETFLFMLTNSEEDLPYPKSLEVCQHMNPVSVCPKATEGKDCSTEQGLKYQLTRVSLDNLSLNLVEERSALQILSSNFRLATCNLHSTDFDRGVGLRLPALTVRQFVRADKPSNKYLVYTEATSGKIGEEWLECGVFRISDCEFSLTLPMLEDEPIHKRKEFAQRHDASRKRLTFLWDDHANNECGCSGRCAFFGKNLFGKRFFGEEANFAILSIHQNENAGTWDDPGFGQSILRRGEGILCQSAVEGLHGADSMAALTPQLVTLSDSNEYAQEEFFLAPESFAPEIQNERITGPEEPPSVPNGSAESLDSFKTSVSQPETPMVNLYGQVNRPVLTSPMLMTGYGKYLSRYKCDNWQQTPGNWKVGRSFFDGSQYSNLAPDFYLVNQGFNSLALVYDKKKDAELLVAHQKQHNRSPSPGKGKDGAAETKRKSSKANQEDKTAWIEAVGKLGQRMDLMVSPLGVEVIQRLLDSCAETLGNTHPVFLVQSLFDTCSRRKHSQPLVEVQTKRKSTEEQFHPIHVRMTLPEMRISFFQCGVVEKMVPFGDLSTVPSLTQASMALATVSDITWSVSTTEDNKASPSRHVVIGNTKVGTINCQLVQLMEKSGSNIGISKSASRSPFSVNWNTLGPIKDLYKPCVVIESCIRTSFLTITTQIFRSNPRHNGMDSPGKDKGVKESEENAELPGTSREPDEMDVDAENSETSVVINFGPAIVNFGLCQPLDAGKDNWPLYDLLAPSLSAWVHVIHRLELSSGSILNSVTLTRELTFAWLLTEALECSETMCVYNPPKSKFAVAKENIGRLKLCPSCQLSLVMLRFCSKTVGSWDFKERMNVQDGLKKVKNIRKGLVALLSHWRPVLCSERLVTLDSALARKITQKSEEKAMEGLVSVRSEIVDDSRKLHDDSKPEETRHKIGAMAHKRPPVKIRAAPEKCGTENVAVTADRPRTEQNPSAASSPSGSRDSTGKFEHKRPSSVSSSGKGVRRSTDIEKGSSAAEKLSNTTGGSSRKHGRREKDTAGAGEDLYKWMRDQPKSDEKKRRLLGASEEVNPMDVPLSLYFKPIFDSEHLEIGSDLMKILDSLGGTFAFSVEVQEVKIGTVEPKQLTMVGSSSKRIGYTERLFLELEGIQASGKLRSEPESVEICSSGGFPVQRMSRQLSYKANVRKVCLSAGFPTASFLNQMNFIVRSVIDTHLELKRNEIINTDDELSFLATPNFKRDESGSEDRVRPWCDRMMSLMSDYLNSQKRLVSKDAEWSLEDFARTFVIDGVVDIGIINIQGILRELVVYVTINRLQVGHSARERRSAEDPSHRVAESSITVSVHRGIFILSEIETADMESVMARESKIVIFQLTVNDSRLLLSRLLKKSKNTDAWDNCLLVEVGPVMGDVPMHPGVLHGVVMRTSRNIQRDFERLNPPPQVIEEVPQERKKPPEEETVGHYSRSLERAKGVAVVNFSIALCSLNITASLLPSLKATYQFEEVTSSGTTGSDAKFVVEVPKHGITFDVQGVNETPDGPLQPIKLSLPLVTANGGYVQADAVDEPGESMKGRELVYQEGGYLKTEVTVGKFEHTLTTCLLNQLLFVQEAFRREIGDIVSRITAERGPLLLPGSGVPRKKVLFSVSVRGPPQCPLIQLTATTPTSTAVRLTVEHVFGQLTNRWVRRAEAQRGDRLYGTASVQLSLVLGQFIKNAMFEEVEPEFQQFAYFKTHIQVQNVETETDLWKDTGTSYTYLIGVHRPIVFIQPSAVDKAVLLWLNYKNTYEFWNEQRQQIRTRTSRRTSSFISDAAQAGLGSVPLFLKLSVDSGIYICMPLYSAQYPDTNSALLLSLDNTDIQVCSKGSLVSRGRFTGFCIRFVEDFDAVAENWRPDSERPEGSNACFVPEGTYSLCSKTSAPRPGNSNAEWILNVKWQMKGMDLQLNTRIGKLTSLLLATLTSLAGEGEESLTVPGSGRESIVSDVVDKGEKLNEEAGDIQNFPVGKKKTKAIERAMNDQARVVTDLKEIGATEATIEVERRKLQKLEAMLFTEFRKEMVDKLRKQSEKATSLKDRFGLAVKPPSGNLTRKKSDQTGSLEKLQGKRRFTEQWKLPCRPSHQRAESLDATLERIPSVSSSSVGDESQLNESTESDVTTSVSDGSDSLENDTVGLKSVLGPVSSTSARVLEETTTPAVDLYLDVEINVEKGKFVLHKQSKEEPETGGMTSARSFSGKNADKKRSTPRSTLQMPRISETTIEMPSVVVKSYYASHSGTGDNSLNIGQLKDDGLDDGLIAHMKSSLKKGNLFLQTALESMPEETVVSPHLLDFLQETLEAIPHAQQFFHARRTEEEQNLAADKEKKEDSTAEPVKPVSGVLSLEVENAAVVSFPVDIVLFFSVQQSSIRFTSQPDSMMECLLKLPQLKLICTSRKASDLLFTNASIPSRRPSTVNLGSFRLVDTDETEERSTNFKESLNGGIYCTAVFKDFSLFIFHPYGRSSIPVPGETRESGKDALSLAVDSIIISISRSRNVLSAANLESDRNKLKNSVHFSLLVDIGKASFKYDMRKLKEILSFPKAWYRNAIMRRLFLGDESTSGSSNRDMGSEMAGKGSRPPSPRTEHTVDSRESVPMVQGGMLSAGFKAPSTNESASKTAWEALVLFTVQCGKLEIDANMGQTMGLTSWITKSVAWAGDLNINSRGRKHCKLKLCLESSVLDAKTGIISGSVAVTKVLMKLGLKRSVGKTPEHEILAKLGKLESRIEWMSSTTLVGRCSELDLLLKDNWEMETERLTKRLDRSMVRLQGTINWDNLKILISKPTASNFMRIYYKLAEFFQQHLKSGRGILYRDYYGRDPVEPKNSEKHAVDSEKEPNIVRKQHRHWQKALAYIMQIQLEPDSFFPLAYFETGVGGKFSLSGRSICLGCFHGDFKATRWMVLHLKCPVVSFDVDARDVPLEVKLRNGETEQEPGTKVTQILKFQLGNNGDEENAEVMAVIAKVDRSGRYNPPATAGLEEWLRYALDSAVTQMYDPAKEHTTTPLLKLPATNVMLKTVQTQRDPGDSETTSPSSSAGNGWAINDPEDPNKPTVRYVFESKFHSPIMVRSNVEEVYFIKEIIDSYIQENTLPIVSTTAGTMSSKSGFKPVLPRPGPAEELKLDARVYECDKWEMEPTVRLMERSHFELYGQEWLMNYLGLKKPNHTIPKWTQRGFMDPLDGGLALLMERLLLLTQKM